jgi:predicted DNA-binding transcriptional regulator AlpA
MKGDPVTDLIFLDEVPQRYPVLNESTLRYWRHKGEGPPSARIGRRVVYRVKDIEAWIDAQFAAEGAGQQGAA